MNSGRVGPPGGSVDWDLLADHLGGALTGTPEGARVERLVASDPGWARAAGELSAAMDAVATDLRTLPAPAMPDDIAARLDSALAAAARTPEVGPTGAPQPGRPTDEPRRPPGRPGSRTRRRRMVRWSAGLAVAAGVAAFAAIGISSWQPDQPLPGLTTDNDDAGGAAMPEESRDDERADGLQSLPPLVVATGSNYEATTLEITEPTRPTPALGSANRPSPPLQAPTNDFGTNEAPEAVPDPLVRLWSDPAEREECLRMIEESIQPPPVTINTVDFATYEDEPALVIWATAGDGSRWAWVSGPGCGAIPGDPDVWFQTQLS